MERIVDRNVATTTYEFPDKPVKKSLGKIIYDSSEGRLFGRTPTNWAQLFLFYLVFYTVLAALFAICMQVLFVTLNEDYPKWKLHESIIGTKPGLSYRPFPERVDESLTGIRYTASNKTDVGLWVDSINSFLDPYTSPPGHLPNQITCDYDRRPVQNEVCAVDISKWGDCTNKEGFGYSRSSPCIFLKLNRIYGWNPETYSNSSALPEEMPQDLKDHIASVGALEKEQVWVSCSGKPLSSCGDIDDVGPIQYVSGRGFASYYYPYTNSKGYLSPLVAIRLQRPPTNCLLEIECRVWAKNIEYRGGTRDRRGSFSFELEIKN